VWTQCQQCPDNMQPQVIGNTDAELDELSHLTDVPQAWSHPFSRDELVNALFSSLALAASAERERTQKLNLRESCAKRNRRDTYLDAEKREEWQQRARAFLERRAEICTAMPIEKLYSALAMQHFLDLDMVDINLPADMRRSEDGYTDDVSTQFRLDAPRGCYVVDGERFHYAESDASEVESAFVDRLILAVRRVTPSDLLARVTNAMSQSGLAALERASLCSAAVSGGTQEVSYQLAADPGHLHGVLVTLQVQKSGFTEYILARTEDPSPLQSDGDSCVCKSAIVAFSIEGDVDIVQLTESIDIRFNGESIPLETLCDPIPDIPVTSSKMKVGERWHAPLLRARRFVRRACRCRERWRQSRKLRQ